MDRCRWRENPQGNRRDDHSLFLLIVLTHIGLARSVSVISGRGIAVAVVKRLSTWIALEPGPTDWVGGLRLACAFLLPVAVGLAVDEKLTGLFVGVGAFMVANADLGESFVQRLRSMIPATIVIPAMTALGMAIGSHQWVTVAVGAVVILVGGFIAAVGREAALFGTFFAIAFVVGVGVASAPGLTEAQVALPMVGGGLLAIALSGLQVLLVEHRPHEPPEPWSTVPKRLADGLRDPVLMRQAIGMALAGAIGLTVVPFTHQSNGAWLVTGALMVFKPGHGETIKVALTRAVATVFGAALAGGIAALTSEPMVLLVLALALTWCAEAVVRRSFAVFVLLITPLSILLINVLVPGGWEVAYLRVADVAAGSALAIVISTLLRAWRPR
jgi:uncharacterized membrane protein YccC